MLNFILSFAINTKASDNFVFTVIPDEDGSYVNVSIKVVIYLKSRSLYSLPYVATVAAFRNDRLIGILC